MIQNNSVLLITGGTGSFGNAVLRRMVKLSVFKEIRIFSRDEKKQDDMRRQLSNDKLKFYIGDVRNQNSIDFAMQGVDFVFHAAALKQVPSCEFFPMEATLTNVIGTQNVINAAIKNNVKKIICLSTDKAAYPINAMGITKALMEKVAIASSRNISNDKTIICLTRYGNVMGSRGSVIPLFIEQLKNNKPLSITDKSMTRFFMSLDEAVDLVLFAFENGNQGDLFVNKAPASSIDNLANSLMDIFGVNNAPLNIIGTRHGEKQYETLCTREEMIKAEDLGNFFRIPADNRDLNYEKYFSKGDIDISSITDYNSNNAIQLSKEELIKVLLSLPFVQEAINP